MHNEIEARFLAIDKTATIAKLKSLGAEDKGEVTLREVILYDRELKWPDEGRFVRIRSYNGTTILTYKQNKAQTIDSAREIEFAIPDAALAEQFLECTGLIAFRHQEKKRHTFVLDGVTVDIDTWPRVQPYAELEGKSEEDIKAAAIKIGFTWGEAVYDDARAILQNRYNIPLGAMRWFTFDRFET